MPDQPRPASRRLWLRISVRGLIALVLIIGGWLGWIVRSAQIQREALNALDQACGHLLDCGWEFPIGVTSGDESWAPEWLVDRVGIDYFGRIKYLSFYRSPADDDLIHVAHLSAVEGLGLGGARLITDSGLGHLGGLTHLRWLELGHTQVSDGGLVFLKELRNLEVLDLRGTRITDAGLVHLGRIAGLRELDIRETEVTVAGVRKLQEAMPKLKISR